MIFAIAVSATIAVGAITLHAMYMATEIRRRDNGTDKFTTACNEYRRQGRTKRAV